MTREQIKAILENITKEQLDSIMHLNGSDVEKAKTTAQMQIDDLNSQLTTAKDTLKSFEGVNVSELQEKITKLNEDLTSKDTAYNEKLANLEFNSQLESAISSFGAKNSKAVKAQLDIDTLKQSKNQAEDIKKALESVKTENDYLFTSEEPIKSPVKETGNTNITELSKDMFAKMGYSERIKLKTNDPQKYEELRGK